MAWTPEQKAKAIADYLAESPTPETSTEIIKQIAEDMDQSANGVRMILVQAEVYVKKDAVAGTTKTTTTAKDGAAPKRVSKESAIASLVEAITAAGGEVDQEILDKLTGKAAMYFASVIKAVAASDEVDE